MLPQQLLAWETLLVLFSLIISWKILARFKRRSVLKTLRGPPKMNAIANFLEGHFGPMFDVADGPKIMEDWFDEYGGVFKIKGPFGKDHLCISDPHALEHMLLKAPNAYEAHAEFTDGMRVLFGPGLLSTVGEQHKKQRRLLNPVFSASHMADLAPLFYDISRKLEKKLKDEVMAQPNDIDILSWMTRTTIDFIGQGGLGYQFGALDGMQNEYREASQKLSSTLAGLGIIEYFGLLLCHIGPAWFRRLIVEFCPIPVVQELNRIVKIMHKMSMIVYAKRKQLLPSPAGSVDNTVDQKDILSLLLQANSRAAEADRLSKEEITAQLNTFAFAGHNTMSTILSQVFDLLGTYPDVQAELRAELSLGGTNTVLDYNKLMALPLLDAVCKETLRLHPPAALVSRMCLQENVIPLMYPVRSSAGELVTKLPVPKGTTLWISIAAANRSQLIWGKDAREWKPQRWLVPDSGAKARLPGAFSSIMTFLGGHRTCLGWRMAVLEMKMVVSVLLPSFIFQRSSSSTVVWHFGDIQAPFVKGVGPAGADRGPEMPMKLSVITDDVTGR